MSDERILVVDDDPEFIDLTQNATAFHGVCGHSLWNG